MREILFRGKRVDGKGFLIGQLYYSDDKAWITDSKNINLNTHRNIAWFEVHPESVGQFTGLLDKNGKRIFEGDVLRYESQHTKHIEKFFNNVVEFASGQSLVGWRMRNGRCVVRATPFKFTISEIIGNIHDSPHNPPTH